MGNLCYGYKDETSVGGWCYLASTLNITMFVYSHPYLLLPETWLKNAEGMDQLNCSTGGVHRVAATINVCCYEHVSIVIVPCGIKIKYTFQLSDIEQA